MRLHRLEPDVKPLQCRLDQTIHKEGDEVDGIYLVTKGSVKYQKAMAIEARTGPQTQHKWLRQSPKLQASDRKVVMRDVAIFEHGDLVGFEELMRGFIMAKDDKAAQTFKNEGKMDQKSICSLRDFTLVGNSGETELLFIQSSLVMPILRIHNLDVIKTFFEERAFILKKSLSNLQTSANRISSICTSETKPDVIKIRK